MAPMPSKARDLLPRWRVYRLRKSPAEFLGSVQAKDEAEAIARIVADQQITDPEKLKRLFARRTG
jgi:hypothetical protein